MTAMICSAVFAKSLTLSPTSIRESTIRSMPNVTIGPGSMRATQSNVSNGGNDRSIHLSTRYRMAMSGAVRKTPVNAPKPRVRSLIAPSPSSY